MIKVKLVHEKSTNLFLTTNLTANPKDHKKEVVKDEEGKKEPISDCKSWTFGNVKNPELGGDFEISIQIGKQKLSAWFNVPFLIQVAHLSEACENIENCEGDNYFEEASTKIVKSSKRGK